MPDTDATLPFVKPAGIIRPDRKPRLGFLVLTDTTLVHVPSRAAYAGMPFGALGAVIANSIGKRAAMKSATNPPPGSTVMPLDRITATGPYDFRLARNILQVTLDDGSKLGFGTKYRAWQPHLARALSGTGAQVAATA